MRFDLKFHFLKLLIIQLIEFDLTTVKRSHLFFHGVKTFCDVRLGIIEELSLILI